MKTIDQFSLEELKDIQGLLESYQSQEDLLSVLKDRIHEIEEKQKDRLNVRFNMDMFIKLRIFDPSEFKVIKENHIMNLQQLIDCDLDQLVGITPSVKQGLEWVRTWYDMSSLEEDKGKTK